MKSLKALFLLLFAGALGAAEAPALTLENPELKVTWRLQDAAIVQVEWRQDGTRLLPADAPGLGAAAARFPGSPALTATARGQQLVFAGAGGERVVYLLPARGHVLELAATSTPLTLLPVPADPAAPGRIFTLEGRRLRAVAWADILKEPLLGFLGAQRKQLPPASARLGMDAGASSRETPYFAALWDLSAPPERSALGYRLAPGGSGRLYLGPKQAPSLAAFGPDFPRILDFGWFGAVGQVLFQGLHLLQSAIPNWGWALVLFSVLLRLLLWPLNSRAILQGLRGRELAPQVQAIQARHSGAEQQKEVMAFYQRNGHNPMGGCLGSLAQMPILFALYGMLGNVFELRHAPWLFWIRDLAVPDPLYVLPILLGLAMAAQQSLSPTVGDPAQGRLLRLLMPAVMVLMFAAMPAGLNLYYLAFNLVGLAQTGWLTRNYQPRPVLA
jgi:YidC/Oxa1 family membrane protein insertase